MYDDPRLIVARRSRRDVMLTRVRPLDRGARPLIWPTTANNNSPANITVINRSPFARLLVLVRSTGDAKAQLRLEDATEARRAGDRISTGAFALSRVKVRGDCRFSLVTFFSNVIPRFCRRQPTKFSHADSIVLDAFASSIAIARIIARIIAASGKRISGNLTVTFT